MCLSHSYFDSCKLLPHPHYPLARASTGLLCAAVKTASVVKNLDLTSFCWWVLIFKLGEMVKGQIPHHPCHGSYICEKTFTRSPSSHLLFPSRLHYFCQRSNSLVFIHCHCSSLDTFSGGEQTIGTTTKPKCLLCVLWKGEESPWKCFLSNNCSQRHKVIFKGNLGLVLSVIDK